MPAPTAVVRGSRAAEQALTEPTKTPVTLTSPLPTAPLLNSWQLAQSSSGADGIQRSHTSRTSAAAPHGHSKREEGDRLGNGVGPEPEQGHDAEVPAAPATAGPVEVLALPGLAPVHDAVRRHDLDRRHLVARQPVGPGEHADATTQGQAGDAHGRARAAWQEEALRGQLAVDVDQLVPAPTVAGVDRTGRPARRVEIASRCVTSMTRPGHDE